MGQGDVMGVVEEALETIGLTQYESAAYTALISLISATATEISQTANIPRSRVYDILKSLKRKGFIEIEKGKPLRYHVIAPREIIANSRKRINEILKTAEKELTEIYEDRISEIPAPIWLIHGQNKIIKKELEILSRAKKDIKIRAGFLFKGETEKLIETLKKLERRSVDVKIMTNSNLINKNIFDDKIKFTRVPPIKMIVRDSQEMMWVFARFREDSSIIPESAIGVWNQYQEIAKNYAEIFDSIWNSLENFQDKHPADSKSNPQNL